MHTLSLRLCLRVRLVVALDAVEELLTAFGVSDVLDTDVDALFEVAVANDLVDNYSDCRGSNIVNDAGATE